MPDDFVPRRELEHKFNEVWKALGDVTCILEGPPYPALRDKVHTFITETNATQAERDKQHKANQNRLNLIIAILTALAGYLAVVHH